jgi:site-specific DNA-methyltransferase (adenine-specific)
MYRAAAPWGRLCLNVPLDITRPREPLAADWVQVLRSVGWIYRTVILWKEGNISRGTARGSVDSPGAPNVICPAEVVLVFHKGTWNLAPARRERPEWGRPDLTRQEWLDWTMASWSFAGEKAERVGGHPAAFPEELARRCIKLFSFPRAVVGDPFCGSGTTCLAACRLGRRVLGSDISRSYVALARARLARELGR